jgi:hypothetical protein
MGEARCLLLVLLTCESWLPWCREGAGRRSAGRPVLGALFFLNAMGLPAGLGGNKSTNWLLFLGLFLLGKLFHSKLVNMYLHFILAL